MKIYRHDLLFIIGTIVSILTVILLKKPILLGILSSLIILIILSVNLKYNLKKLIILSIKGSKNVSFVILMLSLIGMMIPMWMNNGTLASLIIYGLKYLGNSNILLLAFISTAFISMILGTGIGTVGTMGLVFLGLSYSLDIPKPLIVGAIVSGSYIGDRTSPLSSMANLLTKLCDTDLMDNIKLMIKTLIPVFIITSIIYYFLGLKYLADETSLEKLNQIINLLDSNYKIGLTMLIPPILILISSVILRKSIVFSISSSLISSILLSFIILKMDIFSILKIMIFGYHPLNTEISNILSGSGLISMFMVLSVILASNAINEILKETNLLENTLNMFSNNITSYSKLIHKTALLSSLITALTCSQILTTLLTATHFKKIYDKFNVKKNILMLTISDTGIIIVSLMPWNLNAIIVKSITNVSASNYAIYAFLPILLPILTVIYPYFFNKHYNFNNENIKASSNQ